MLGERKFDMFSTLSNLNIGGVKKGLFFTSFFLFIRLKVFIYIRLKILCLFPLNNIFVATNRPNAKRNKKGFILYAPDYPPLNSRVKN